jgi:hypothetical protein
MPYSWIYKANWNLLADNRTDGQLASFNLNAILWSGADLPTPQGGSRLTPELCPWKGGEETGLGAEGFLLCKVSGNGATAELEELLSLSALSIQDLELDPQDGPNSAALLEKVFDSSQGQPGHLEVI